MSTEPTTPALTPAARRILDAAAGLFYARGIHAVGVEAIAAAANVTKKTLYDRFGSKEALIAAYLDERGERWQRWLMGYVDAAEGAERLLVAFDALADWLAREPRRGCAFVNAHAELTESDDAGRRVARAQKQWMLELLTRLATDAGATEPRELAAQLFMLHEGASVSYAVTGDDDAPATARAAAARLVAVQVA